jgi:hypothetical protein
LPPAENCDAHAVTAQGDFRRRSTDAAAVPGVPSIADITDLRTARCRVVLCRHLNI